MAFSKVHLCAWNEVVFKENSRLLPSISNEVNNSFVNSRRFKTMCIYWPRIQFLFDFRTGTNMAAIIISRVCNVFPYETFDWMSHLFVKIVITEVEESLLQLLFSRHYVRAKFSLGFESKPCILFINWRWQQK